MTPRLFLAAFLLAVPAFPQSFSVLVEFPDGAASATPGGTIPFQAEAIGSTLTGRITISYRGSTRARVLAIDRTGSSAFTFATAGPSLPLELLPGDNVSGTIRFTPTSGAQVQARLQIGYSELATPSSSEFLPREPFFINLSGAAPELILSYTLPGGNATELVPNAILSFPPTIINTTVNAAMSLLNRGTAPARVGRITSSGAAFTLTGLPLPPVTIAPSQELRFGLAFSPTSRDSFTGAFSIEFAQRLLSFRLEGSGASSSFLYDLLRDSGETRIAPNQTIALPDTTVGERASVFLRVINNGNADGLISSISVLGAGYQLSELPFLPLTLGPRASVTFTINFIPTTPGRTPGRLRVGEDTFELSGNALGPALVFSYQLGGATTPVAPNGSVLFSPVPAGREASASFTITNSGTNAATISSIFLTGSSVFTLSGLPPLPLLLEPAASASFTITFAPISTGVAEATLRIGNERLTVIGSGGAPPTLAPVLIEGPRGTQQPLQQLTYTLTLAEPYPLNLIGTLRLDFNSEVFTNDATVQFATGGRTVNFTIPAGQTRAIFPNNETQIRLQTGSVAGSIALSAAIATSSGLLLTEDPLPSLSITIPQSSPQLVSVQLGSKTPNGFSLLVTGYSTARTLSRIDLSVTAAAGEAISNSTLTFNVEPAFLAWYQNAQSQQFGSLFTATVPVSIEGAPRTASSPVDAIQSVSVTIANALGTSQSQSVSFR